MVFLPVYIHWTNCEIFQRYIHNLHVFHLYISENLDATGSRRLNQSFFVLCDFLEQVEGAFEPSECVFVSCSTNLEAAYFCSLYSAFEMGNQEIN